MDNKYINIIFIKKILVLITVFTALPGYMFLEQGKRMRRPGIFPVVALTVQDSVQSPEISNSAFKNLLVNASQIWFDNASAQFGFDLKEKATEADKEILKLDSYNCSTANSNLIQEKTDIVYMSHTEDPDCTGDSCVYLWTCGDEILHGELVLKDTALKNPGATMNMLQHQMGHLAGLSHCAEGARADECQNTVFTDDRQGLQALYGVFVNQYNFTGDYKLDTGEVNAISDYRNTILKELIETPGRISASAAQMEMLFYYDPMTPEEIDDESLKNARGEPYERRRLSKSEVLQKNRQEMNSYYGRIYSSIHSYSDSDLINIRRALVMATESNTAIVTYLRDKAGIDAEVFDENLTKIIALRKAIIEEQKSRQ